MKLLIDKKDIVTVTVYCYEVNGEIEGTYEKSGVSNTESVETIELEFRKPNYSDSNALIHIGKIVAEGEETRVDIPSFQEAILKTLLVKWNLKNEDGEAIPLSPTNINALHPNVARAFVAGALEKIKI